MPDPMQSMQWGAMETDLERIYDERAVAGSELNGPVQASGRIRLHVFRTGIIGPLHPATSRHHFSTLCGIIWVCMAARTNTELHDAVADPSISRARPRHRAAIGL